MTPPNAQPRPPAIERFLGQGRSGGPRQALGLGPEPLSDETVLAALAAALASVNAHPHAASPEADEVRLALHAAAAHLLAPAGRTRAAAPAGTRADPVASLEHDALLTLAMHGGWNRDSLRRLSWLAHARGIPSSAVPAALGRFTRLRPAIQRPLAAVAPARVPGPSTPALTHPEAAHPAAPHPAAPQPEPAQPDRITPVLLRWFWGAMGVLAFAALGLWLASLALRRPPAPTPTSSETPAPIAGAEAPAELFPTPAAAAPAPAPAQQPVAAAAPSNPADDIRACLAGLAVDRDEAIARFDEALARLAAVWIDLPPDQLASANDAAIEFFHRLSQEPDAALRAINAVVSRLSPLAPGSPVDDRAVASGAWAAGMLARLSRERDWPARLVQAVDRAAANLPVPSGDADPFRAGASAWLFAAIKPLTPAPPASLTRDSARVAAWTRWAQAVSLQPGASPPEPAFLAALEAVLIDAPDPTADRTTFEVVEMLARRLPFDPAGPSRAWLLRQFDSQAVTNDDLFALTKVVSSLPDLGGGTDPSMVLAVAASPGDRQALRGRYATLWNLAPAHAGDAGAWRQAAREALAQPFEPAADPVLHIRRAAALSRLSEAASWAWAGEPALAQDAALAARRLLDAPPAPAPAPPSAAPEDGQLAIKLLSGTTNAPARLQALTEALSAAHNLGPVDAEAVVREALRAGPMQLRRAAADIVRRQPRNPAVLNALLEALPFMPRSGDNFDLIARIAMVQLPSPDDPARPIAARRALVERLLEVTAASGDAGRIDEFAADLAESYRGRNGERPLSSEAAEAVPAHLSAAQLRARWRRWAEGVVPTGREPVPLARIESRLAARSRIASGPVQDFAAEGLAVCELMALVIVTEQPSRAPDAAQILQRLADARRRADHILAQIHAAELAALELWLLRSGGPDA